jgi:hypothetical protein
MMRFIARWLSSAWVLSLSFAAALVLMQAPALTDAYAAALLQVTSDARGDIEQRLASARRHYALDAMAEEQVVTALARHEPSNAETLRLSITRTASLREGYERIAAAPLLLRPVVALVDATLDAEGYQRNVLRLAVASFVPALQLSLGALAYGLAGVVLGSLVGHGSLALLGVAGSRLRRRPVAWYVPPRERRLPY